MKISSLEYVWRKKENFLIPAAYIHSRSANTPGDVAITTPRFFQQEMT
jgi:hypothetical protein